MSETDPDPDVEDEADADTDAAADASDDESSSSALLFGEYNTDELEYADPSTRRYITVTPIAHTLGRHASKQFSKSDISIVERLINRLMQDGQNSGKKQQATRIVRDAFDAVHARTDENPVQVLVTAVENAAPREETVRLKYGGISVPKAVDISPQRRVDQALKFLASGVANASYKSSTSASEALADQLTGAADYNVSSYPINQKEELERVAAAAR